MQLIHETDLSAEEYVSTQAWRDAKLERCPNHPDGGCRFARHGTYARKTPVGLKVARYYCPDSPMTFSLLPRFMAAGMAVQRDKQDEERRANWRWGSRCKSGREERLTTTFTASRAGASVRMYPKRRQRRVWPG